MAVVALLAGAAPALAADRGVVSLCLAPPPGTSEIEACRAAQRLDVPAVRARNVRLALARALVSAQRYTEAVDTYAEAARQWPDDAEARLRLGEALLHLRGDAQGATDELQAALRLEPQSARAYGALGVALHALGQQAEAAAAFAEAARLDPEFFLSRPASRAMDEAARRGTAWPAVLEQPATP